MGRTSPRCTLLNQKCELQLTSPETFLKVFQETGMMSRAFSQSPQIMRKCPRDTQSSAHLQQYCLLHHDPKIPCIIFLWLCYPHSNSFGNHGNYPSLVISG